MKKDKGFSLIELLIVISIMAILGSLALSAFSTARKQGRDSQRKSEMIQYKTALESYYAGYGDYPNTSGSVARSNQNEFIFQTSSPVVANYMGGTVLQGVNAEDNYLYFYTGDGTVYKLYGNLELPPDAYWEICANGKSGSTLIDPGTTGTTCDLL